LAKIADEEGAIPVSGRAHQTINKAQASLNHIDMNLFSKLALLSYRESEEVSEKNVGQKFWQMNNTTNYVKALLRYCLS
jgi:hypothetical protein